MKHPRFVIAESFKGKPFPKTIVHLLDPHAIFFVEQGHITTHYPYRHLEFNAEKYTVIVHFIAPTDLEIGDKEKTIDVLINRAWDWFKEQSEIQSDFPVDQKVLG